MIVVTRSPDTHSSKIYILKLKLRTFKTQETEQPVNVEAAIDESCAPPDNDDLKAFFDRDLTKSVAVASSS